MHEYLKIIFFTENLYRYLGAPVSDRYGSDECVMCAKQVEPIRKAFFSGRWHQTSFTAYGISLIFKATQKRGQIES